VANVVIGRKMGKLTKKMIRDASEKMRQQPRCPVCREEWLDSYVSPEDISMKFVHFVSGVRSVCRLPIKRMQEDVFGKADKDG
jgi:hypothetical protein